MELDLNILNTKSKIDIDDKFYFPKEDLKKAGILDMQEVTVKGTLKYNEEYQLNLTIKGEMILPCSLTLEPVNYPFNIEIDENIDEFIENS